jgi:hypothetical protein
VKTVARERELGLHGAVHKSEPTLPPAKTKKSKKEAR